MSLRKAAVLDLATAAYEIEADVRRGLLEKSGQGWTIAGTSLEELLERYAGQQMVVIFASMDDERPLETRTCRTCGTEYTALECPRCREARIRLRGR